MWAIFLVQYFYHIDFHYLGIHPRHLNGLQGIFTTIFVHGDFEHILSNTLPFFFLGTALFLYYREFALRLLFYLTVLTGIYVWIIARDSWHIGASGLVYALASFHLLSAILRKNMRLLAFSMLVIFLYGGMVWGFFPEFFPEKNISFESHIMGAITGFLFAWKYRNIGIQKEEYQWPEEDELSDDNPYWEVEEEPIDKNNTTHNE
jgi:membrane associated rhomboid family serine protease